MALREVGIRLTAEVAGYMSNIRRAGAVTKDFTAELDKSAKAGKLDAVADRAGMVGIALAGMAGYAIKAAADFDKSMSAVKAATNDSTKSVAENAQNMKDLRAAALQAGKDTMYSATEAADGITELGKAGIDTSDILKGGLKGALSLAAAGQISVGEAAETAASAMTQFKLKGDQVPHVADLLAAAAGKAQGSVHDMGYALNQSGLVASQFGLSIEDTTGALAEFANAGLLGSDAGTSFKTMLLAIANPSGVTAKKMQELGIEFYDAQGKFIGLSGVATVLRDKLGDLTEEQRNAALGQIFGNDAIRAATILYKDGAQGVAEWKGKVTDAGYAARNAATLTDNLAGDIERLKGSLETFAIESGSGANSGLRIIVKSLDALVGQFSSMPTAVGSTITVLAAVSGAAMLSLAAFIKLRKGLAETVVQLEAMGPAGAVAASGLSKLASFAGKAGVAFIAMEAAAAFLNTIDEKTVNVDKLSSSLQKLADTGQSTGELNDAFGKNFKNLDRIAFFADNANHGLGKFINTTLGGIPAVGDLGKAIGGLGSRLIAGTDFDTATQQMAGLDQALTSYMDTTKDAKKSSDLWNQVLRESGMDTQQLAELLPNAYKKVGELNTAADKGGASGQAMANGQKAVAAAAKETMSVIDRTKKAQDEFKTVTDSTKGALRGETDALIALSGQMQAQIDPVFGFIEAQKSLAKAQKEAKTAQHDLDKAIENHGPKSKEAKTATDKLDEATRNLATSAIDLQGKAGVLGKDFEGKLSPAMIKTLKAAGVTNAQIKILTGQFKDAKTAADNYDDKYEAKTSAPGAKDAKKQLEEAHTAADIFDGRYQADASAPGAKQAKTDLDKAYTAANNFAGPYAADVRVTGQGKVESELRKLSRMQQALKNANTLDRLGGAQGDGPGFYAGGYTGPGPRNQPAGIVHADEQVINSPSRRSLEAAKPGGLDYMNRTGQWPEYAGGGYVWPFPVNASKTKVPEAPAVPGSSGGPGYKWMEAVVRRAFPGMPIYSDYRPGAITLTGNRSYHGFGRAVDFAPSLPLAEWINLHYMRQTKELITPWQSLNIHNGARHRYSALIENQHNFAGGNAHDHWAMAHGGTITEPIFGYGASGRTYSFGENYMPEKVTPSWQAGTAARNGTVINLTVTAPVGSHPREIGAAVVGAIGDYLEGGGELRVRGQKVL